MQDTGLHLAVEAAISRFEADFAAGDVAQLVANYYAEDPVVVGEGIGVFPGRDGAATYFSGAIAQFGKCKLTSRSLEQRGDYAFETGEVQLTPHDTTAPEAILGYVVGWRKGDDGWKVRLDYFVPIAAAEAPQ